MNLAAILSLAASNPEGAAILVLAVACLVLTRQVLRLMQDVLLLKAQVSALEALLPGRALPSYRSATLPKGARRAADRTRVSGNP
jgi:hypothetical protein